MYQLLFIISFTKYFYQGQMVYNSMGDPSGC
jgi:hypothetical protein